MPRLLGLSDAGKMSNNASASTMARDLMLNVRRDVVLKVGFK
jgi:hypothetical protein